MDSDQPAVTTSADSAGVANVKSTVVITADVSARGVVSRTFDTFANHFMRLCLLASIVTVPVLVLTWRLPDRIGSIASQIASAISWGALTLAFAALARREQFGVRGSLGQAAGRFVRLFVIGIVLAIILAVAALPFLLLALLVSPVFVVPGILLVALLGARWGLAVPAAMLEGRGVNDAFRRSAALVTPAWRTAVPVTFAAALLAGAPIAWGLAVILAGGSDVVALAAIVVVSVILGPIGPGLLTTLFLDLRAARNPAAAETSTVETLARDSGGRVVPAAGSAGQRGLAVGVIATAVVLVGAGWSGLGLLNVGSELSHRGEIHFGTAPGRDICDVSQPGATFAAGTGLYWATILSRTAAAGDTIRIELVLDGTVVDSATRILDGRTDCLGSTSAVGLFTAGEWTLRILDGDALAATGSFTIH